MLREYRLLPKGDSGGRSPLCWCRPPSGRPPVSGYTKRPPPVLALFFLPGWAGMAQGGIQSLYFKDGGSTAAPVKTVVDALPSAIDAELGGFGVDAAWHRSPTPGLRGWFAFRARP